MAPAAAGARKTKFDLRREASREALLAAAMQCFHRRGYAATRVDDIAERAGHTSGAVYFHFQSKAGVFWEVVEYRRGLRAGWQGIVDGLDPSTSLEQIVRLVFARFDDSLDNTHAWTLVTADFLQQHRDDPDAVARLAVMYSDWIEELSVFFAKLKAGGWVDDAADPRLLATLAFAFVEGYSSHAIVYSIDPTAYREVVVEGVMRLLAPGNRP